jgi:hypothetical protein
MDSHIQPRASLLMGEVIMRPLIHHLGPWEGKIKRPPQADPLELGPGWTSTYDTGTFTFLTKASLRLNLTQEKLNLNSETLI